MPLSSIRHPVLAPPVTASPTAAAPLDDALPSAERDTRFSPFFWTVLLVALASFFLTVSHGDLHEDGPLYAWLGKRMAITGTFSNMFYDWDGLAPYYNKPPLQFWLTAIVYKIFGVSVVTARVVPAMNFTLAALVLYKIVRLQYKPVLAASAAIIFCLQRELWMNIAEVRMDGGLLLGELLSTYALARILIGSRGLRWFALLGTGVGLGLMTRGFGALVSLPIFFVAACWTGNARRVLRPGGLIVALAAAVMVAGPWYGYQVWHWGSDYLGNIEGDAFRQNTTFERRGTRLLYYSKRIAESYAVWLIPAVVGVLCYNGRRYSGKNSSDTAGAIQTSPNSPPPMIGLSPRVRRTRLGVVDRIALSWLVLQFVLIHFSALRAIRYALPIYPWLSLLAALGIFGWIPSRKVWVRYVLPYIAVGAVAACAVINALGVSLVRTDQPELQAVVTAAHARQIELNRTAPGARPNVYLYGPRQWPNKQLECYIQFYTSAKGRTLNADEVDQLRPGDIVAAGEDETESESTRETNAPAKRIDAAFPHAALIANAAHFRVYVIR